MLFEVMESAVYKLDESVGDMVGGREVPGLTINAAFEEYDDNVPFQAPDSPLHIFAHERDALRQLIVRDLFDDLSAVELPANVPEGGGQTGTGPNGSRGGGNGNGGDGTGAADGAGAGDGDGAA